MESGEWRARWTLDGIMEIANLIVVNLGDAARRRSGGGCRSGCGGRRRRADRVIR
ncbi:MAG: hypothetical protein R3F11_09795 [Verrucomicrobiales bacterium]